MGFVRFSLFRTTRKLRRNFEASVGFTGYFPWKSQCSKCFRGVLSVFRFSMIFPFGRKTHKTSRKRLLRRVSWKGLSTVLLSNLTVFERLKNLGILNTVYVLCEQNCQRICCVSMRFTPVTFAAYPLLLIIYCPIKLT